MTAGRLCLKPGRRAGLQTFSQRFLGVIARPCARCGRLTPKSPCTRCQRYQNREHTRSKRQRRPYTAAERDRRAAVVAAHRATYGDWCPGVPSLGRDAHASSDLTADHVHAVGAGGSEAGPLEVLCRPCNSAKGFSIVG